MLNTAELLRRRNQVLEVIDQLSVVDSMAVMGAAMRELAERSSGTVLAANDPAPSSIERFLDGSTRFSVERDPEIREFIHSVRGCTTLDQLAEACRTKFGSRSPSRSAIHRYIQRLKFRQAGGQET